MSLKSVNIVLIVVLVQSVWSVVLAANIPKYIEVCKRDQDTISSCVKNSIEVLRPKLAEGIPELNVPGIEPLIIPQIVVDQGNQVTFKAVGRDIRVKGASNFKIKKLDLDLDQLEIRATVFFPRLEVDGKYDVDARLLQVPIHGKGDIRVNATKCLSMLVILAKIEQKNGANYLKFTNVTMDLDVKDYSVKLTNLFNGNIQYDDIANQIVNQNKAEFLQSAKPYLERTISNLLKRVANRISGSFTYDDILPLP